jgi:hypothetical protein
VYRAPGGRRAPRAAANRLAATRWAAAVGGLALVLGGYSALGLTLAGLFALEPSEIDR